MVARGIGRGRGGSEPAWLSQFGLGGLGVARRTMLTAVDPKRAQETIPVGPAMRRWRARPSLSGAMKRDPRDWPVIDPPRESFVARERDFANVPGRATDQWSAWCTD